MSLPPCMNSYIPPLVLPAEWNWLWVQVISTWRKHEITDQFLTMSITPGVNRVWSIHWKHLIQQLASKLFLFIKWVWAWKIKKHRVCSEDWFTPGPIVWRTYPWCSEKRKYTDLSSCWCSLDSSKKVVEKYVNRDWGIRESSKACL